MKVCFSWRRLNFTLGACATRIHIWPKHGAGSDNILEPAPRIEMPGQAGHDDWGTGNDGSVQCRSRGFVSQVKVIFVAGRVVLRFRWRGYPLQVCVFGLNGDANRPLVHSNVAGQAIFADRGRYFA